MSMQHNEAPPPSSPPPKRAKPKSRPKRWAEAVGEASTALSRMEAHLDELENAVAELRSIQEEYEEWKDNLSDNLQSTPVAEKLEEVCSIEIEELAQQVRDAIEDVQGKLDECEAVDLPRGFGRD